MAFCKAMLAVGAMDYAAPQYYDGPGLSDPNYIVSNVTSWIKDVAGGDASKIVVGFGMESLANYSTIDQIKDAWNRIKVAYPTIRGAFLWQHKTDSDRGWAFANQLIPLIGTTTTPPVVPPPVVTPTKKVILGTASYPLAGTNIARVADALVVYTPAKGRSPRPIPTVPSARCRRQDPERERPADHRRDDGHRDSQGRLRAVRPWQGPRVADRAGAGR